MLASKLLPERFGDKLAVEATGRDGAPLYQPEPDISKVALSVMALIEAVNPRPKTIDQIAPPLPSLPPSDDTDRRRRQAQMDGSLPRPSLGEADDRLPAFEPQPAPRRPPPEDLADWRDKAEAEKVHQRIARISRQWP
jgi:hypothetical protein